MPTGYTAAVEDGTMTEFNDFAWQCARAFGALIMMRDDPMSAPVPQKFEPQTEYHDKALARAEAKLVELRAMSADQARVAAADAFSQAKKDHEERIRERNLRFDRYKAMEEKVLAWEPPTAEHVEMKKFMLDQLRISMPDMSGRYDQEPVSQDGQTWLADQLHEAERSFNYHTEERAKEIARTAGRNQWVADLRRSLDRAALSARSLEVE